MNRKLHILNGDSLVSEFLKTNIGQQYIVFRECLIDGPAVNIEAKNFLTNRVKYLQRMYGNSATEYGEQWQTLYSIVDSTDICLWFEEDAFCQVNFWYLAHYCQLFLPTSSIYLVLPLQNSEDKWRGFGALGFKELLHSYENRVFLTDEYKIHFTNCWTSFSNNNWTLLDELSNKAIDYLPDNFRMIQTLMAYKKEDFLLTNFIKKRLVSEVGFGTIFREFSQQYGILGLGDLQVKRCYDKLLQSLKL